MRLPTILLTSTVVSLAAMGIGGNQAIAKEGFEKANRGKFTNLKTAYGTMTCAKDMAEISGGAKSGANTLRLFGGANCQVKLDLDNVPQTDVKLSAWAERWTGQAPFAFTITAQGPKGDKVIYDGKDVKVGGFKTKIDTMVPSGTKSLLFSVTSPENKGVKIDDLLIVRDIPMTLDKDIRTTSNVYPVMVRMPGNPVVAVNLKADGCRNPIALKEVVLDLSGTTNISDIESITVIRAGEDMQSPEGAYKFPADASQVLGTVEIKDAKKLPYISVEGNLPIEAGDNYMWACVTMKDGASIDGRVVIRPCSLETTAGKTKINAPSVAQRIGVAVVKPGDFNSKFYRIPGLARTKKGTLLAVYDIRYDHAGDLPANIDVGVSRSTDGGRTWSEVRIAMNDSEIAPELGKTKGVGDPAILVDEKTGRIWVAAIWSHKHSIWGSKSGDNSPDVCGQLVLTYSDDDGKTWSKPINITEQTKQKDWRILFNGPGGGICMKNGHLVFAAQYWDNDGTPWSTIVYSKDGGKSWHCGVGVHKQTTEAQVTELKDGSIMINARCNWRGARVVGVTKDYGKTWEMHPTNRDTNQLCEPVCQGSIFTIPNVPQAGRVVFFSNPNKNDARSHMTIKASLDDASSWPSDKWTMYDVRPCWGYSCLAPVDDKHIGVIYEGRGPLYFIKFPYEELVSPKKK